MPPQRSPRDDLRELQAGPMTASKPRSRVYLLRHARSGWAAPGQRDFDRTLDEQGRADADRIGKLMKKRGYQPDLVLCSSARRCQETWDAVGSAIGGEIKQHFTETLYTDGPEAYLDLIAEQGEAGSVMLVGHNPMMEETAGLLLGIARDAGENPLGRGFPTAGLVVIDFDVPLSDIRTHRGALAEFARPEDA